MKNLEEQNLRLDDAVWRVLEEKRAELCDLMMVVPGHTHGNHAKFIILVRNQMQLKDEYWSKRKQVTDFFSHAEVIFSTFLADNDLAEIRRSLLNPDCHVIINATQIDDHFVGCHRGTILATASKLHDIIQSRIFLNVCCSILRNDKELLNCACVFHDKQYDEKMSTATLCDSLISPCRAVYEFYCRNIACGNTELSTHVFARLFEGITTVEELNTELSLMQVQSNDNHTVHSALAHFINRDALKQRASLSLRVFQMIENTVLEDVDALISMDRCVLEENMTLSQWMEGMAPLIDLDQRLRWRKRNGLGSDEFWDVIIQLLKSPSLMKFLKEIIDEDLRNLIDTVGKHSEEWLDFMDVKQYLTPFLKTTHLRQVYGCLLKVPTGLSMDVIPSIMAKCSSNLRLLQELYRSMANRSKITLDVICSALHCGQFCFTWDDTIDECQVSMRYLKEGTGEHSHGTCTMEELNLLRSRALLIITSKPHRRASESEGANASDLQDFVACINIASSLKDMYTDAKAAGFIELETHKLVSVPELIKYENILKEELSRWNSVLDEARNEHFYLNFFSAKQLKVLEGFFCAEIEVCENVRLLFHYVYPCFDLRQETRSVYDKPDNADLRTRLRSIAVGLERTFETKSKCQRRISLDRTSEIIDSTVQPGEVFIAHLPKESRKSSISVVMQLCINTTGSYPEPSEIIFCQQDTSFEELELLLRRCSSVKTTTGQNKSLYIIVDAQNLTSETQLILVDETRRIQQRNDKHLLLAIIYRSNRDNQMIRQFPLRLTHRVYGISDQDFSVCLKSDFENVEVVTSEYPGLGKTTHVMSKVTHHAGAVTVVVGGAIDKSTLLKRLVSENQDAPNLHLDVKDMKEPGSFDTFLFELIVVGMASSGERRCRCSWKRVFIEIANSLGDHLQKSLVTCMKFKRIKLAWQYFADYIIPRDICSPEQMVCRYKQALDDGRIDSEDISIEHGEPLPDETCRHILKQIFQDQIELSFASVGNLVNVLSAELTNLSCSGFFTTNTIAYAMPRRVFRHPKTSVRSDIVKTLIYVATEITRPPARETRPTVPHRHGKPVTATTMVNRFRKMFKWSDSNHLLIVFNRQDRETITPLYRDKTFITDAVKRLLQSQDYEQVPDYNEMSQDDLREVLERVCRKSSKYFNKRKLKGLQDIYVLTPDNILKMMLIIVRIEARVPVIIMGETGCGKTMLITYLALLSEVSLKTLRLHAGTTETEILDFIQLLMNEALQNGQNGEDASSKEVWAFFDEVNTCDHLGILAELICHRKFNGRELPSSVVCMAACNPYRLQQKERTDIGLQEKDEQQHETNKLVYFVNPLPEAMSDFIWDFGTLDERDEKTYIARMVKGMITPEYETLFTDLLFKSQRFIRERADYSVSLRDIDRCRNLVRWMTDNLLKKKPVAKTPANMSVSLCNEFEFRGMLLALTHCYHSRLVGNDDREEYRQMVTSRCGDSGYYMSDTYIKHVITAEQKDLLSRMTLPSGTASNEALRENVFVILVAIMTKQPIFVVGKPGCSKSLSMNLIENNLRGSESDDEYFKTLPAVFKVSYQCSESSTSDDIKKVFTIANKYLREGRQPVVLLDEVGLAERSQANPLKVLHSLLDPDGGHFSSVAMVGISNYVLDAAKMNRAIHLSRPDPTIEELVDTAKAIRDGLDESPSDVVTDAKLHQLSDAYYEYKKKEQLANVHGLRDFYSMIKYLTKQPCTDGILDMAILRNFGGFSRIDSVHILNTLSDKSGTMRQSELPPTVAELIAENLNDNSARHLMVVTKGHSGLTILQQLLHDKKRVLLCGSKFQNDFTEEYDHRMLSKIILHMETDCILVLRGLESIYGCLYDMLNQNYFIFNGKQFCRIALGANSNMSREVHPNFKCIVLVDERHFRQCDPPFLNRFEKQAVSFSDVLTYKQRTVVSSLSRQIHDISIVPYLQTTPEESFLGYHDGTLPSLVIRNTSNAATDFILMKICMKQMLALATSDAILRIPSSHFGKRHNDATKTTTRRRSGAHGTTTLSRMLSNTEVDDTVTDMQQEYFTLPLQRGIKHFMETVFSDQTKYLSWTGSESQGLKLVLYTHSSIHENVNRCLEGTQTSCGPLRVQVEKLSVFNSERHLDDRCHHYWLVSDANMLVIQCTAALDAPHVLTVKCLTDHFRAEYLASRHIKVHGPKHICVIIHVDRGTSADKQLQLREFDFLNDWQPFTLETLEEHAYAKTDMTATTMMRLLDKDLDDIIMEQLWWCFSRIRYTTRHRQVECVFKLITVMAESTDLIQALRERLKRMVTNSPEASATPDWEMEVACNKQLLLECSTMAEARKEYIKKKIREPLAKIVFAIERLFAWDSLMYSLTGTQSETRSKHIQFWLFCFRNVFINTYTDISGAMGVHFYVIDKPWVDLRFPFFVVFHEKIQNQRTWLKDSEEASRCNHLAEVMKQEVLELMHDDFMTADTMSEYIDDFCKVAVGYAPAAEVRIRIEIIKRLLHMYGASAAVSTTTNSDGFHWLANWYITSWAHDRILPFQIELVMTFLKCKQYSVEHVELLFREVIDDIQKSAPNSEMLGQSGGTSVHSETVSYHLVSTICRAMLPTEEHIDACGGIILWRDNTWKILEIASKLNYDSETMHLLTVSADLLNLLTKANITDYGPITRIAVAGGNGDRSAMERDQDVFCEIRNTLEHIHVLRTVPKEELDNFLCLFIGRCIEANNQTPLLSDFISVLLNDNKELVSGARAVLFSIIDYELDVPQTRTELFVLWKKLLTSDLSETPTLVCLDECLQEQEQLDGQLAVSCCDVMEEILQDWISRSTLVDVPMGDFVCELVKAVTSPKKCSIQLLAAISFIRIVFKSFAGQFEEGVSPDLSSDSQLELTGHIHTLINNISTEQNRTNSLQLYLLRCMRRYKTRFDLAAECSHLSGAIHALESMSAKMSVIQFQNRLGFHPMRYLKQYLKTESEFLKESQSAIASLLRCAINDPEYRFAIIAFAVQLCYLARSIGGTSVLSTSMKSQIENEAKDWPSVPYAFLCQLLRSNDTEEEQFTSSLLQLSESSTPREVSMAAVALHVASVFLKGNQKNAFTYQLGKRHSPGDGGSAHFGIQQTDRPTQGIATYYCSCGQVIVLIASMKRYTQCPACEQKCQYNKWEYEDIQENDIDCADKDETVFGIKSLTLRVLHHACLLVENEQPNTKYVASQGNAARMNTDIDHKDLSRSIRSDWDTLEKLLNLGHEEVGLFLHVVIRDAHELLSKPGDTRQNLQTRDAVENALGVIINKQLQRIPKCLKEFLHVCSDNVIQPDFSEVDETDHISESGSRDTTPNEFHHLLCYSKQATFADFRSSFLSQDEQFYKTHPFLTLFLRRYPTLQYIKHLLCLIKWNEAISSHLCHRLDRAKAYSLSHGNIINDERYIPDKQKREELNEMFKAYKESWNAVRLGWRHLTHQEEDLQPMAECEPIITSLFCRDFPQNQLWRMIEALQETQNTFLRAVAVIAANGYPSHCLKFLNKNGKTTLPSVVLQEARKEDVIHFDDDNVCLFFHDLVDSSDRGIHNRYDFVQIENKLVKDIVRNKAILQLQDDTAVGYFVFADELFHSCSAILKDVNMKIPQTKLPNGIANSLTREHGHTKSFGRELLEQLEILLGLLKRTGGNTDELLSEYCKKWYSMLPPKLVSTLVSEVRDSNLKLNHVVDLYQVVEGLLSKDSVQSLQMTYCHPIPEHLQTKLNAMLAKISIYELERVQINIERFIFRYLKSGNDMRSTGCLVGVLTSKQYMPSLSDKEYNVIKALIMKEVQVSNIRAILMLVKEDIEKRREFRPPRPGPRPRPRFR